MKTDIVGLCCALNYNKELTVDSCIYRLFLIAYTFYIVAQYVHYSQPASTNCPFLI